MPDLTRRAVLLGLCGAALPGMHYFPIPDSQGGWRTAPPKRKDKLDRLFDYLQRTTLHGGLLVVHRGWLVYERYFGLGAREATPNLASVGKSLTSVAVGILMVEHARLFPQGLEQRVCTPDHLPSEAFPLNDQRRAEIKLGHLLCMTGGLLGNHPGYKDGQPVTLDPPGPDGWKAMLDETAFTIPLWCNPGEGYSYATSSAHLCSIIVRKVAGMELSEFVRTRLALPLGWSTWAYGHRNRPFRHTPGGGGICLRPTDVVRSGYLLLREGRWHDRQIVPTHFVRQCGRRSPYNPHYPYSLQFNVNTDEQLPDVPVDAYWKAGAGGHCLYIIPSLDLVAFKMGGRADQYDPVDTGLAPSPAAKAVSKERRITVDPQIAIPEALRQIALAFR